MKKIFIGLRSFTIPTNWNQLTKDDLLFISHCFNIGLTKEEFVIFLSSYFSKMNTKELLKIDELVFKGLENHYNWLWQKMGLTKQLIPVLRIKFKRFFGPEEILAGMSYEQFIIWSETYYMSYIETKNPNDLDFLIASLYTKKKNKFVPDDVELNVKLISKITPAEKTAILFFYEGNRANIALRFPKLMSSNPSEKKKHQYNFLQVIESLNGGDVSKNNEIKQTNIHEVFTRLQNMVIENEKATANSKKNGYK